MTPARQSPVFPALKRGLVAILRGVKPQEAEAIAGVLIEAGFDAIEVPLNSPQPFHSIELISRKYGEKSLIGAGTVLKPSDVEDVAKAGGRLIISPNIDPIIVERSTSLGLISMPGVLTATEAHLAVACGASALKFFPASMLGAAGINAIKATLPSGVIMGAVGGVGNHSFAEYIQAGVRVFGIGSNLYKPGDSAASVQQKAEMIVRSYDQALLH